MSRFFRTNTKGFTLLEVMVTLSIMTVILTVILLNQSSYTEKVQLANLADQMTLTLTQMQSYGIAVKEIEPGSEDFSAAYGISLSILPSGDETVYLAFADKDRDGRYDGNWNCSTGGSSECLEKVVMSPGNFIDAICLIEEDGDENCIDPQRVDISFLRPNTEAIITTYTSNGQVMDTSNAQGVKISLQSPSAFERLVVVYKVGQISALEPVYEYQYPAPAYDYPSPQAYLTPYVYPSPIVYRDLTVTKLGTGTGTVTGASINCGSICNGAFANGSQVVLSATPTDSSNAFSGWSGNCSGTGNCVLTMDGSKIARATFNKLGPEVTAFDVQPRNTLGSVTATFTATDATVGVYLSNANLRRATKSGTCTITDNSGCSWSTVATTQASRLATFTGAVGVTVSGNSLTSTGGAWASGATSVETIPSGDGFVEFTANDLNNYKMGGLGNGDTNQSYTDIEYAAYPLVGGALQVYEQGTLRGSFGTYTATDIFKVAIESGVVKYYKNDVVFYTSTVSPTSGSGYAYPYRFDSSFYPDTTIANIKVSSNTLDSWTGNMTDTPPQGFSYIYGVDVYDNFTPTPRFGSEPAKIQVDAGDFAAPVVTAFDVQPRSGAAKATATFTTTDSGGSHLDRAELMRATKNTNCTVSIDSGCSWSTVATTQASRPATFTGVTSVTVSGNSLINATGDGWNAGASSNETITSGDGFVEFSTNESNVYKMGGLGNGDANLSYTDIEYAAYPTAAGTVQVYEGGSQRFTAGGSPTFTTYVAGDIFKVAIESGVVKYYKNGVLFYTSTVAPTSGGTYAYPYRFDSSFYPSGSISNVKVSSNTLDSWTGDVANSPSAGTYIYGLKVYDKNPAGANVGSEPARIEVTVVGPAVSAGAASVVRGQTILLTWSGISPAAVNDWIGLNPSAAPDSGYIAWMYTSSVAPPCGTTMGGAGQSSGSCLFTVPASAVPGTYNFRVFANGLSPTVPISANFTVSGSQLSSSPSTIPRGNNVSVTWAGIHPTSNTDWVGLYAIGAADTAFSGWFYNSSTASPCNQTSGPTASVAGTCQYTIPIAVPPGSYEFRLFSNNGYTKLETSPTFTVTAP